MDSKYYPFERNHYFYGKLLTVRDFESEQRYHSAKRRLSNRLLFGSGVVAGLQVIMVDDTSVSVQAGLAFDDLGREVVLPESRTLKLSMVEGFKKADSPKNLYLCVAFDEVGKEPVQPVANPSVRSDEVSEYNRLLEGTRFFIKESAPGPMEFEYSRLTETAVTVYENDSVRIIQVAPRYVQVGSIFEVRILIESVLQTPRIDFQFKLDQTVFQSTVDDSQVIRYVQPLATESVYHQLTFQVQAPATAQLAAVQPAPGTVNLHVGDDALVIATDFSNPVQVVEGAAQDYILADYFRRGFDEALSSSADHAIHLAKISLVQAGPTYMIEQVRNVPCAEYVYSAPLLQRLGMVEAKSGKGSTPNGVSTNSDVNQNDIARSTRAAAPGQEMGQWGIGGRDRVSSGTVDIDLLPRVAKLTLGKLGKGYYSPEIEHGLGEGPVSLQVAVEEVREPDPEANGANERLYMGAVDVFAESPYQSSLRHITLGVVQFPRRGTFVVGARISNLADETTLKVRWWAVKKGTAEALADAQLPTVNTAEGEQSH